MAINLNVSPYYDDFDPNKKFNRVVFKPGVAVQARELTQMQDYFYETIKDFADYVFVDGAAVRGCEAEPLVVDYVKINDTDSNGSTVSNDTLANYIGDKLVGSTTGIEAIVYDVKTGVQTEVTDKKVIYLQYVKGNEELRGDGLNRRFDAGETLTVVSTNSDRNGDTFVVNTDTDLTSFTNNFYGMILDFSMPEGVLYAQGRFIKHETQKIRLDPYTAKVNYFLGVVLNEEIVTSDDDGTLLDPATGAFNYNAPGADRTKITTTLTKVPFGSEYANSTFYKLGDHVAYEGNIYEVTSAGTSPSSDGAPVHLSGSVTSGSVEFTYYEFPENFTSVYKIVNGRLQKKLNEELKELSELGKTLARRTSEESGDYVINPFTLEIIEHLRTVRGVTFNLSTDESFARGTFVNHNGNLYEVVNGNGTSDHTIPPTHTEGAATSGSVVFQYRGDSYRIDNDGYHYATDATDPGDPNFVVAKVSPGIAYVDGYRREFIQNNYVKIRKGTSTKIQEALDVSLSYGNFFDCVEVVGNWNLEQGAQVQLGHYGVSPNLSPAYAATGDGDPNNYGSGSFGSTSAPATVLGTCRVRSVKHIGGTIGTASAVHRIFVYDVKLRGGDLKDARVLFYNDPNGNNGVADLLLYDLNGDGLGDSAFLQASQQNRMVFPVSWMATKTLYAAGAGTLDTQYYYTEEFNISTLGDGTFEISTSSLGSEVTLPYSSSPTQGELDNSFYVVTRNTVTINGTSYSAGQQVRLTPSMVVGHTTQQMDFDLGTVSGAVDLYIQVKLKVVDAEPVQKNYNVNRYVKIRTNDNAGGANGPWGLGITDVKEIVSVYITDSDNNAYLDDADDPVDFKDEFVLDNGQRDSYYGHAQLVKKGSSTLNTTNKYITVKLSHFVPDYSSSNGTYFAVDSYPVDDTGSTGIYTFEIPYYRSQKLGTYDLRDCIDFRPYVKNTAVSASILAAATQNPYKTEELELPTNGIQYPITSTPFTTDVEYYLPRTDRLYISKNGTMKIVEGVSDIPSRPPVLKEGMQIAEIRIPPYPSIARNLAVKFGVVEKSVGFFLKGQTRRYTMKDIGAIEKRIGRLEYYLALSLMEMAAKDKVILDANNNDRFKNGIYVNPFDSDLLSDIADPTYNAAYNSMKKEMAPNFDESEISLMLNANYGNSGWSYMGQHITRPYEVADLLENRFATKTRNCVGELLFNYIGKMELFPRSDNWAETSNLQPMNLTASNQAGAQAVAASVNASQNIVGSSTTFEMGAVVNTGTTCNPSQQFVPGASNQTTNTVEFTQGNDGSFQVSADAPITGGFPQTMIPVGGGGMWEQVSEGQVDISISGEVNVNGSYDQVVTTQDIQASTTNYLLNASATSAGSLEFNIGNVVRDVSLLPYMRNKKIGVRVTAMKPNTRLYVYFDNDNVTEFCAPAYVEDYIDTTDETESLNSGFDSLTSVWASGSQGDGSVFEQCLYPPTIRTDIITNEGGDAAFILDLPGNRFPVGTRRIWVVDDPQNRDNFITTQAENQYSAFGLHQATQEVSLTAEIYTVEYGTTAVDGGTSTVGTVVTDVKNTNAEINVSIDDLEADIDVTQPQFIFHPPRQFGDPIAQSFTVENSPTPVFLSQVKVFFRERPGEKDGVTLPETLLFSDVSATELKIGRSYKIVESGNTNWADVGASSSDVGTIFTATQAGTGTGVVQPTIGGITMEIRKCLNGYPTKEILGTCTLSHQAVKTTPDISGGNATNFDFRAQYATTFYFGDQTYAVGVTGENSNINGRPVVLDPTEEYAFVLLPQNNNPNYEIWVSKLGENKIGTQSDRVTADETYSGMLFTSSNNRTWTPHQGEDIKFVMYANTFPTGTGTVEVVNEHAEFVIGEDFTGGKPDPSRPGTWYSFNHTINEGGVNYAVGDTITLDTSRNRCPKGIIFEVTEIDSGLGTGGGVVTAVKPIQYHDGSKDSFEAKPYTFGSTNGSNNTFIQSTTSGGGAGFEINLSIKSMRMKKIDNQKNRYDFILPESTNLFDVDDILIDGDTTLLPRAGELWWCDQVNRKSMYIQQAGLKKIINTSRTSMTVKEFIETDISIGRAVTNSTGTNTRGNEFVNMTPTLFTDTSREAAIYSLSEELGFTGTDIWSKKSYRHHVVLTNTNPNVSPILNPSRLSAIVRENVINNTFADEETPLGGQAKSRFISKIVRLADGQEADDIKLSVSLFTPPGSSAKVYFRGLHPHDDSDIRRELNWIEMEYDEANPNGAPAAKTSFIDLDYKLPSSALNAEGKFSYNTDRISAVTITNTGSGYASIQEVPLFISGGGDVAIKSLSSGSINEVEIVNPGSGYNGVAPTIQVGYEHELAETYQTGQLVAFGGNTYEAIVGGITAAVSGSEPTHTSGTATDGTITWQYRGTQATMTATIDTAEFVQFKYFQCKIVFCAENTSLVPKAKQLRMIACQAGAV